MIILSAPYSHNIKRTINDTIYNSNTVLIAALLYVKYFTDEQPS
jgi:hypothetical protein